MSPVEKRNLTIFAILCLLCLAAVFIFSIVSAPSYHRSVAQTASSEPQNPSHSNPPPLKKPKIAENVVTPTPSPKPNYQVAQVPSNSVASTRLLYYRTNALGNDYGKLTVAALPALDHPRYSAELSCERLYFAGSAGVCLAADRGMFTNFYAVTFDNQLRRKKNITINGEPSRIRISPDGRWAAITVFLAGHSYSSLAFSTQTTIVDMANGTTICDLEQFSVTRQGEVFKFPDFNFWGVTFKENGKQFYATLWSAGKTYLVEGDLLRRTARVIYDDVECPSLSPDNTRIAFKKRIGPQRPGWHIHLLRLADRTEVALGETRNVDDQVEWLDNDHILYALSENPTGASASTDLWQLSTKPGASPRLFLKGAFSPSVVSTGH
jgi:WD40-like Beta Propeller Repeat